jgi:hypothetical protein
LILQGEDVGFTELEYFEGERFLTRMVKLKVVEYSSSLRSIVQEVKVRMTGIVLEKG